MAIIRKSRKRRVPLEVVIPQRVREWREKLGLSQSEVARRCELSPSTICKIENAAATDPPISTMLSLMQVLGCWFIQDLTE
ncbi:MAG: helix-turn-helix domain-containing protein [Gammaproteobacteria bacterium]|nr:helix-turn-helix domain-containing protein [Gammaproteobacteria bacterium]